MKLGILDQTHLVEGISPAEAFRQTVQMAQFADQLGLERYWVSEHHGSDVIVGAAPEVLASFLLAKTERIKIGTGGVMLTHYAPFKVAEQFKVMSALAPGRVNLGVGRAPGGAHLSTIALKGGRSLEDGWKRDTEGFPSQIDELLEYMEDELPEAHPLSGHLFAAPRIGRKPEIWVLGTSPSSGRMAAEKGLPFAFAQFIQYAPGVMEEAIHTYAEHFKPSRYLDSPQALVTMKAIVAESDAEAEYLARSALHVDFWKHRSKNERFINPDKALADVRTEKEWQEVEDLKATYLIGSKETVTRQIADLSTRLPIKELMAITPIFDIKKRKRSVELLEEAVKTVGK
ncbi:LLM class flavin-dependent oxidoreductase [Aciduricibacillus chroicocephali]|uniref:LLM class flavin-dependent oxidoreductase n=1 Tax=Aciduricibacillus chroicocephali TaxID=3054939 RepID=A0ABY9KXL3_9BACI|nr:LLM class flavin-dependent oxidoreductase [Bacillaceae bacterium 44XB]